MHLARFSRRIGELWARPLAPRETDFELLFLTISCATAGSCLLWLAFGLPWPKCWFRQLTGIPCPTCGATRCAMALIHGHLGDALHRNPFIFLCYGAVMIIDLYAAAVLFFQLPRLRVTRVPGKIKYRLVVALFGLVGANWVYLFLNR
jgi:hypothetical protein